MVDSIRRVIDIIGEIGTTNLEQSTGVDRVGDAVMVMDQTTHQNATLVEHMAAAIAIINVSAEDLIRVVDNFKLEGLNLTHF